MYRHQDIASLEIQIDIEIAKQIIVSDFLEFGDEIKFFYLSRGEINVLNSFAHFASANEVFYHAAFFSQAAFETAAARMSLVRRERR